MNHRRRAVHSIAFALASMLGTGTPTYWHDRSSHVRGLKHLRTTSCCQVQRVTETAPRQRYRKRYQTRMDAHEKVCPSLAGLQTMLMRLPAPASLQAQAR